MPPLRVAAITYDYYPFEMRALRLSEAAADAGYDVHVFAPRQPNERR